MTDAWKKAIVAFDHKHACWTGPEAKEHARAVRNWLIIGGCRNTSIENSAGETRIKMNDDENYPLPLYWWPEEPGISIWHEHMCEHLEVQ